MPAVTVMDLSDAELRALRLALNRITDDAGWEPKALALEFSEILELAPQIDLEVTGFETGEIDILLDGSGADEEDDLPDTADGAAPANRERRDGLPVWSTVRYKQSKYRSMMMCVSCSPLVVRRSRSLADMGAKSVE
jgi:hypothetical protein